MDLFYILIVVVTGLYICVCPSHEAIYLKLMSWFCFFVCKVFLKKADNKKERLRNDRENIEPFFFGGKKLRVI